MSAQIKTTPVIHYLTAGQSAFNTLDQGTMIVVEEGSVYLKTQLYLAELIYPQCILLYSGQSHTVQASEHCQIQANGKVKVTLIPPASQPKKLWAHLIARVASFRRGASGFLNIFTQTKI